MIPAALTGPLARYTSAIAIGASAAWWIQGLRADASEARMAKAHAEQVEEWATAATQAVDAVRTEEQRRTAAVEKSRVESFTLLAQSNADRDRYRAAYGGLRRDIDTLHRDAIGRDPTLADGSASGATAVGVLSYMLGRAIDRAEFLAGFADRARIAGLTCERAYDGLTVKD